MRLYSSMTSGPSIQWITQPLLRFQEKPFWNSWNNTRLKSSNLIWLKLWKLHKRKSKKRRKSRKKKSTFWVSKPKRVKTSPSGIQTLSLSQACLTIMTSQVATSWGHGLSQSGKRSPLILTQSSSQTALKTLTSQCSFQDQNSKSKRIMLKDSHHKSLGSPSQESQISLNQLPSDQPVKPLCIQLTLTGSRVTETYHLSSINGPTLSDGNSSIQPHSSEQDNSCGKKDTPLTPLLKKLNKKCTSILISTQKHIKKFWPFQSSKVSRLNRKNSQVDTEHQPSKHGSMKMVVPSKLLPATIWDKTSPRCSVSNSKMIRSKKILSGKQVGDSQPDLLVLWLCNTVMIRVLSYHQEPPRLKLWSFQFHLKERKHSLTKLAKNSKLP